MTIRVGTFNCENLLSRSRILDFNATQAQAEKPEPYTPTHGAPTSAATVAGSVAVTTRFEFHRLPDSIRPERFHRIDSASAADGNKSGNNGDRDNSDSTTYEGQ